VASVLIVEDEADLREIFHAILRKEGYDVSSAAGAFEALAAYDARRPDVVVSDVLLPDASGLRLIEHFTRWHTPVIVVSGTDGGGAHDLLSSASLLGACATLRKPVRRADLVAAVGAALVRVESRVRSGAPPAGSAHR
jgi:DNA-binding NtrC family response regulator